MKRIILTILALSTFIGLVHADRTNGKTSEAITSFLYEETLSTVEKNTLKGVLGVDSGTVGAKAAYGATGNAVILTDAVVTGGSATLTSATANFTSADIGKTVAIPYAGTGATVGQTHLTTIASIDSTTSVQLAAAPFRSIQGSRTLTTAGGITNGGTNLTITGANWDAGDIGKRVVIPGAGLLVGNGGGSPLPAYITGITSSTVATVSRFALATVTSQTITIPGATVIYGTDDTTALQSAITGSSASKKTLILEGGIYLTTAALIPVNNTKIIGAGPSSVICPVGSGFPAFGGNGTESAPLTDITYSDFTVEGIGVTVSTYDTVNKAFYHRNMLRPRFMNLNIRNTSATSIGCDFMVNYLISGCNISRGGRQVQEFGGGGGGSGVGIGTGIFPEEPGLTVGCNINDCGNNGIFIESQSSNILSRGHRIIGNDCRWNFNQGVGDRATDGTVISGNTLANNGVGIGTASGFSAGLYSKNTQISGNIGIKNGVGIELIWNNGTCHVRGNQFDASSVGLSITLAAGGDGTATLICADNIFQNSVNYAVNFISGTLRAFIFTGNAAFDAVSGYTGRAAFRLAPTTITRLTIKQNNIFDTRGASNKHAYPVQIVSGTVTTLVQGSNDFYGSVTSDTIEYSGATVTNLVNQP